MSEGLALSQIEVFQIMIVLLVCGSFAVGYVVGKIMQRRQSAPKIRDMINKHAKGGA